MSKGGGGQPQQQSSGDNSLDFVWMMAGAMISVALIWYFGRGYIVPVIFKIRLFEIQAAESVLKLGESVGSYFGFHLPKTVWLSLEEWRAFIDLHQRQMDADLIPFSVMSELSAGVGSYLIYPVVVIGLSLSAILYFAHIGSRFKTAHTMLSLRQIQKKDWPHIGPVLGKDLTKMPLDAGPWAMADQPLGYAKKHGLLVKTMKDDKPVVGIDRVKAHTAFAQQMGPLWPDLNRLSPYVLALFAIFAAHGNNNVAGAKKLLKKIALSSLSGKKLDYSGARALLLKHIREPSIGRAVGMHAYVLTVMASMLELARTGGVLSVAEFLWLKTVDRGLWYMLCTVGRRTPFVIVAAPYAHWITEKRLRRPLKLSMIDEAITGLEVAISEIKINPDSV